jgi:hypothetical protein
MTLTWKKVAAVVEEAHPSYRAEDDDVQYHLRADDAGTYRVIVVQGGRERLLRHPERYRGGRRVKGEEVVGDLEACKKAARRHAAEARQKRRR